MIPDNNSYNYYYKAKAGGHSMFKNNDRIHVQQSRAEYHLYQLISKKMENLNKKSDSRQTVILCIGTDRSTGDALGPLTGTFLSTYHNFNAPIFGNVEKPVHAKNLQQIKKEIDANFYNPFIIAIDAGLGKKSSVGCVDVKEGPLFPGSGVKKELTAIGDMHITGMVNVGGYMEYLVLQSTRLNLVIKMARTIARGLRLAVSESQPQKRRVSSGLS